MKETCAGDNGQRTFLFGGAFGKALLDHIELNHIELNHIELNHIELNHVEDHIKRSWLENDCIDANASRFSGKVSLVVQYC